MEKNYIFAIENLKESQQKELIECGNNTNFESCVYVENEPFRILTLTEAQATYDFEELRDEEPSTDCCVFIDMYLCHKLVTDEKEVDRLIRVNDMSEDEYYEEYAEDDEYRETVMSAYHRAIFGYGF